MYEALSAMASVMLDPYLLLLIFVTTIGGIVIGVLPGLGATTGAALLLPFTLTMSPVHAIAVLATLYVSATFAGSITAILINTPGTSAAAATTFDGFPLAQRGEAGRALGIAVVASTIGGIFSIIVLCFAAPMLARVAYEFRPPEYFALTIFGLSMLASVGAGGAVRNLIGGIFGVWLATIGAERVTSIERFMFGNYELYEGLSFVPVMIGLFAISELLVQSKKAHLVAEVISLKAVKLPSREDYRRIWRTIVRSSGIGTFIGILPAEGATVASMIGYSEARRWSKNKEEFGKGKLEGVISSETANNAATGAAMIPLLALGLPGGALTAMMVAVFQMHDLEPGPLVFYNSPDLIWIVFAAMFYANLSILFIGLIETKTILYLLKIPFQFLAPLILLLATIGAYISRGLVLDVMVMFGAGILGFLLRRTGYSIPGIVLGLILGKIGEQNFAQGMQMVHYDLGTYFSRPICSILIVAGALTLAAGIYRAFSPASNSA
jgi:putative tricarboxylic transport membrane protein